MAESHEEWLARAAGQAKKQSEALSVRFSEEHSAEELDEEEGQLRLGVGHAVAGEVLGLEIISTSVSDAVPVMTLDDRDRGRALSLLMGGRILGDFAAQVEAGDFARVEYGGKRQTKAGDRSYQSYKVTRIPKPSASVPAEESPGGGLPDASTEPEPEGFDDF